MAPSWASAERTRAGSFSPVATITSAPAVSSASVARRGAARETTTVSGTSAAPRTSWESSGSRASESKTMRRGWRCTPSTRAVSCGSSASAVPMPTATASHSARQRWAIRARLLAGDPLRVAGAGGDLPVERHRRLEQHVRAAGAGVLAERLVEQPRAGGDLAVGDHDLDALVAQDAQAAAGRLLGRVVGGDHHAGDAGLDDRVRAGRRLPVVAARLERDVHRRAARVGAAARGERLALGVRPRRTRCGSPRRAPSPSLTTTAPTSGLGVVRPRPPRPARSRAEVDGVGLRGAGSRACKGY